MWPLLPYYLVLIVLIVLAIRNASKLDRLGEKFLYLVGPLLFKRHRRERTKHRPPHRRLPSLGQGYISVPENEDQFRSFFLHEIEYELDTELEFTAAGEVKLTGAQRRMLADYIEYRNLPYSNIEQAFSDVGLKITA